MNPTLPFILGLILPFAVYQLTVSFPIYNHLNPSTFQSQTSLYF